MENESDSHPRQRINDELTILRTSSTLRDSPSDVLRGYFDIAQLAVNAILDIIHDVQRRESEEV